MERIRSHHLQPLCLLLLLLQAAQPLLERHLHPTVLVRGYARALEDAVKVCVVNRGCGF